jgi:adenosylcobinamide-GDP ribazoletransferase
VRSLGLALAFLTIVPVRLRDAPPLGAAAPWFPLAGALIGAVAGGLGYLAQPTLGSTVAAIVSVAALVILTGALHQDGLADCADALGGRTRDRRLEIMRDSSIGTFGALALIAWFALLTAALAGLARDDALFALTAAAATARWAALAHARIARPARQDGLGAAFHTSTPALAFATAIAAAVALGLFGLEGLAALLAAALTAGLVTVWANALLGGRTGDTLGATVALAEAVVAVVLLGFTAN